MTTGRRLAPIRQLTRSGGTARNYEPDVVSCQNMGVNDFGENY